MRWQHGDHGHRRRQHHRHGERRDGWRAQLQLGERCDGRREHPEQLQLGERWDRWRERLQLDERRDGWREQLQLGERRGGRREQLQLGERRGGRREQLQLGERRDGWREQLQLVERREQLFLGVELQQLVVGLGERGDGDLRLYVLRGRQQPGSGAAGSPGVRGRRLRLERERVGDLRRQRRHERQLHHPQRPLGPVHARCRRPLRLHVGAHAGSRHGGERPAERRARVGVVGRRRHHEPGHLADLRLGRLVLPQRCRGRGQPESGARRRRDEPHERRRRAVVREPRRRQQGRRALPHAAQLRSRRHDGGVPLPHALPVVPGQDDDERGDAYRERRARHRGRQRVHVGGPEGVAVRGPRRSGQRGGFERRRRLLRGHPAGRERRRSLRLRHLPLRSSSRIPRT